MNENLVQVAALVGTWSGTGRGEYPTIEPFEYHETVTFGDVGRPFLTYSQHTTAADDGRPLHAEVGYWRLTAPGVAEVVLAHPTGITEIQHGTVSCTNDVIEIVLSSATVGLSATARSVVEVERRFLVDGDVLEYRLAMAAVGLPLQHHLAARLIRIA